MKGFTTVGEHEILELYGCSKSRLRSSIYADEQLQLIAEECGATVIGSNFHGFDQGGEGFTGVVILAESHITVHTWPEHSYAALDVFMCGSDTDPEKAIEPIEELFISKESRVMSADRGYYKELL